MKSVTDQLHGEGALVALTKQPSPRALGEAKLRVAFATADRTHAPKPTGVAFMSPLRGQRQEIFDDGSVHNPYRKMHKLSGRQRRNMRKQANRNMRARGITTNIGDALKGRQPRPSQVAPSQPSAPEPLTRVGIPVADILGDSR